MPQQGETSPSQPSWPGLDPAIRPQAVQPASHRSTLHEPLSELRSPLHLQMANRGVVSPVVV